MLILPPLSSHLDVYSHLHSHHSAQLSPLYFHANALTSTYALTLILSLLGSHLSTFILILSALTSHLSTVTFPLSPLYSHCLALTRPLLY